MQHRALNALCKDAIRDEHCRGAVSRYKSDPGGFIPAPGTMARKPLGGWLGSSAEEGRGKLR